MRYSRTLHSRFKLESRPSPPATIPQTTPPPLPTCYQVRLSFPNIMVNLNTHMEDVPGPSTLCSQPAPTEALQAEA
jgi:hypothetical protein